MNDRITEWDGGWLQVKVPLPYSLKWVNAYLLPEGEAGWTVIDPGLRLEETEAFWEELMRSRNLAWTSITSIVVTHHHPDHYGMAGWFQERTGAPALLFLGLAHRCQRFAQRLVDAVESGDRQLARYIDALPARPVQSAESQHVGGADQCGDLGVGRESFRRRRVPGLRCVDVPLDHGE